MEGWGSRQTRPVFTGSFHPWVVVPAWTAIQDCGSHSNTTGHCPQHPPCWPGYSLHSWPQFTHIHGELGGEGDSVPAPHSRGWLGEGQSLPQATWPGQMPDWSPHQPDPRDDTLKPTPSSGVAVDRPCQPSEPQLPVSLRRNEDAIMVNFMYQLGRATVPMYLLTLWCRCC